MNKLKKISLLSGFGLAALAALPTLTSCANELNFTRGEVVDLNNSNNSNNNASGKLSPEFTNLQDNNNDLLHIMSVTNDIQFVDYNLPATDENGVFRFLRDRGGLAVKTANISVKQNVVNFLQSFDFYKYRDEFNESIKNGNDSFLSPIPLPSNDLLLSDIYYWMLTSYYSNDKSFDLAVDNSASNFVDFDVNNKIINFNLSFVLKNIRSSRIMINLFNQKFVLEPNKDYVLQLEAVNQPVMNIINIYNQRFFLGWQVPQINVKFINKSFVYQKFNPTPSSNSNAFIVEFLNLTTGVNVSASNNSDAKKFMNELKPEVIEKNIRRSVLNNTNRIFELFPHFATIFNALRYDLSIGQFLYQTSDAVVTILAEFGILPKELTPIISDILKSANTGKGLLEIIVDYKENLSIILKQLLGGVLGNLTDLVDTVLSPIKPNMKKEEVDGFLKMLAMFFPDDNDPTKQLIVNVIKFLLGNYNEDGSLKTPGNPYIFDLLDYLFSDEIINQLLELLKNSGINLDIKIIQSISSIYKTLSARPKNEDGSTKVTNNMVMYDERLITKLFDIKYSQENQGSWWLIDQLIVLLNAMGIQVGENNTSLLYELLHQSYGHKYNRDNLNKTNVLLALNELANAFIFLSDKENFDIQADFIPFDDGSFVKYNNNTYEYDFNFKYKLVFKKAYTFNLDVIVNVLPTDLFLEIFKLTGNEWIDYKINNKDIKIYTKDRYVRINLERILYRMFPRKLPFIAGDSFNMEYKGNNRKLLYSQNSENNIYYHGFNSIMDVESYFDQATPDNGIISNIMKYAWNNSDHLEVNDDHHLDKNPPNSAWGVVANIKYENTNNAQSAQNILAVQEMIQKLFVNKMTFNVNLIGFDNQKPIEKPATDDAFYKGNTFKWLDTDLTQEMFLMNENPQFHSQEYTEYWKMFKYANSADNKSYNYSYVSNAQGQQTKSQFIRQIPSFTENDLTVLKTDLFSLGTRVDLENTQVSIKPITNLAFSKLVEIKGGATIPGIGNVEPLTLELSISIEMLMFQVTVLTPNKVLDISNMKRDNDNYSLTSVNYSNVFDKTFFAPRVAIKMPNFNLNQ